jgi:Uma2 family endonuclease
MICRARLPGFRRESQIMGMPATPGRVTTLDEFFALPEDKYRRHELLDGAYVVSPEASPRHQRAAFALGRLLFPSLADRRDLELFAVPGDIVLGQRTVVEPDLFVVPRPASSDVHWRDVGRPVLLVEILSPSTAARDRGVKRKIYQQAGIPEYWILDLDSRLVERWRPEDERPEILRESLAWTPPGSEVPVEIDLANFFSEVLDR